nr:nucleoprotein [University of Giessen virus]UVT34661.1 nucleoprotein [University of Giessen virus]UVT34665.1 nucleoprotein [University of Giessen virus]UVT34669.1 nucleoprotein [University of Giessen virus]UVT34679.1 nucleoprotein [University of Giessen virus]
MAALQRAAVNQLALKKKLNKMLSPFQRELNNQIFKDVKALRGGFDINKINDVLRRLRKETKGPNDLERLRSLNETAAGLSGMVAVQKVIEIDSTLMSDEELIQCIENIDMIKKKAEYKGGSKPRTSEFESETGMTKSDHEVFNKLFNRFVPRKESGPTGPSTPKSWIGINPADLANQFGTSPAITICLIMMRTNSPFKQIIDALYDISILDSGMFVNASVIKAMTPQHPCLECVEYTVPKNSSGYNITVKAIVKAANVLSKLPKLEKLVLDDDNRVEIIRTLLSIQRELGIKIQMNEERGLFEDVFYKICVSPNGPCVVSIRSELTGRGWENTVFRLRRPPPYAPKLYPDLMDLDLDMTLPVKKDQIEDESRTIYIFKPDANEIDEYIRSPNSSNSDSEVSDPRILYMSNACKELFKGGDTVFMDIEGTAQDPVEIALLNPDTGKFIHIFRMPKDKDDFKKASKHAHGLLLDDISNHPDLQTEKNIEAFFSDIPSSAKIFCQGSDIEECLKFFGRKDLKTTDCKWKREEYMKYHESILDELSEILPCKHSGTVKDKKGALAAPHCALIDCLMFSKTASGGKKIKDPTPATA